MKQLTKKEIIELRAKAIKHKAESLGCNCFIDDALLLAEATIEADEKAGVLMLVEKENGLMPNDFIRIAYKDVVEHATVLEYGSQVILENANILLSDEYEVLEIMRRANTPAYQCKAEPIASKC